MQIIVCKLVHLLPIGNKATKPKPGAFVGTIKTLRYAGRIMKLTAILILGACLQIHAAGYGQKITLSEKEVPIEKVLKKIQQQTNYKFLYTSQLLDGTPKVTVIVKDALIKEVLDLIFKDKKLDYEVNDKTVIIRPKKTELFIKEKATVLTELDIHGKVVDENGKPIAGVTVTVKGTNKVTTTDANGEFVFAGIDGNAVLSFSSVNMESFELKVNNQDEILAKLKTKISQLDDVQIIAYGQTTKRFQTGNVSTVKGEEIERQPVGNALLALEGRVPGLFITQQNGMPGSAVTVRIQGQNSINSGNNPLYVIDGVPLATSFPMTGIDGILGYDGGGSNGNPLNYISPSDIESITVLKDADATSIYGSRAANGAILITTKKGKAGKTRFDLNMQQGWGKVTRKLEMMNTQQYLQMRHEAFNNAGTTPGASDYDINGTWDTTRYTDWQKTLIGNTAHYTNATASVSGGTPALQYLLGGSYHRETTVFPLPSEFSDKKGSVHLSLNGASANQKFHLQFTSNYLVDNNQLPGFDLTGYIRTEPDAPALYNGDGTLNWAPNAAGNSSWSNPVQYKYVTYRNNTTNFINNTLLSYLILPGLQVKTSLGYTSMVTSDYTPVPLISIRPEDRPSSQRSASYGKRNMTSWIVEPQVTYDRILGKSKLNGLLGTTILQNRNNAGNIYAQGFNNDAVLEDISAATQIFPNKPTITQYKYNALFGRLGYNFADKYILDLTARRDGSSRFGAKNQFHNFGSVGAGWIFTQEGFMQRAKFLSFGKLRASYGTVGNDQIGDYQFLNSYRTPYFGGGLPYQNVPALYPQALPNPYLQWEVTRKLQGGVDIGLFKDRVLINATYARNRSSNQLLSYALPTITGFTGITKNFPATVQNTSWEFSVQTVNVKTGTFSWTSSFNLTIPKNKLIAFPDLATSSYARRLVIGQPISIIKAYHYLGVDPATGQYNFIDSQGNATFLPSFPGDYTALINNLPRFYVGLQNHIEYNGFQIDFLFQFVKQTGPIVMFTNGSQTPGGFYPTSSNQPASFLDHWQKPGDNALIGPYTLDYTTGINRALSSNAAYGDASFIRLKNLSVSWELPNAWKRTTLLQNCRLYMQGQNLWTITNYKGLDPENQSFYSLPPLRVWTFGIQVSL